jgi:predicted nucleic acid-binding protein
MEGESLVTIRPRSVLLDSSVVLKWFRRSECWREEAIFLRQEYLNGRLRIYVPSLLILEIANVLRYKPDMASVQVQTALRSLFDLQLEIIDLTQEAIIKAIDLAYSWGLTIYDATFVAIAINMNIPFITADEELIQKLSSFSQVQHISRFESQSKSKSQT